MLKFNLIIIRVQVEPNSLVYTFASKGVLWIIFVRMLNSPCRKRM